MNPYYVKAICQSTDFVNKQRYIKQQGNNPEIETTWLNRHEPVIFFPYCPYTLKSSPLNEIGNVVNVPWPHRNATHSGFCSGYIYEYYGNFPTVLLLNYSRTASTMQIWDSRWILAPRIKFFLGQVDTRANFGGILLKVYYGPSKAGNDTYGCYM